MKGEDTMKRIYNDIPLQSILFLVPGTTKIIVEDYTKKDLFSPWEMDYAPVYTWEGKAYDAHLCRRNTYLPLRNLSLF